jgi:D-arabinose 1-dehydrogenase-like Zn-dependent alcohol dehydrogenase
MEAMVLEKFGAPLRMRQVSDPVLGNQEVLLKVKACGVCRTDIKISSGKMLPSIISLPHVMGHEVAGEVVEIGKEVEGIFPGDKGVVYFYKPCRSCEICLRGNENVCPRVKRFGFELPGGFAEYIKVPAYNLCTFKADIPFFEIAVLPDAIATSYHAIKTLARVQVGDIVLIVGVGGLGIHAVQIAHLCGAHVIAADVNPKALSLAQEFGAEDIIHCGKIEPLQAIKNLTHGRGVDVVLEFVGSSQSLEWSLPSLRPEGCLVLVGYSPEDLWRVDTVPFHFYEWNAKGCRASTRQEMAEVLKLVEEGKIKPVVSKTYPLHQANEALEELKKGDAVGRVVLVQD